MKKNYIFAVIFLLVSAALFFGADNGISVEEQFRLGTNAYDSGDWSSSYQRFYDILVSHPEYDNFEVNFNLGSCCFKLGRVGEARYYFERALLRYSYFLNHHNALEYT